jgi:CheY-like chemotaxis protein
VQKPRCALPMTFDSDFWLIVDDQPDELFFFRRACAGAFGAAPHLHWEEDGLAAREFLTKTDALPSLIVCDLKMPRMNGFELLAWLRQNPKLKPLPFIIFSNSGQEDDRRRAEELGADHYRVKPSTSNDYLSVVKEFKHFTRRGNVDEKTKESATVKRVCQQG